MPPESRLWLWFTRAASVVPPQGTGHLLRRFSWRKPPEETKKPTGSASPSGAARLASQTVMGVAMGLAFALTLVVVDPAGIATLIAHGGRQAIAVCVGAIVLTFRTGAT
jgi:hypothetical protein